MKTIKDGFENRFLILFELIQERLRYQSILNISNFFVIVTAFLQIDFKC